MTYGARHARMRSIAGVLQRLQVHFKQGVDMPLLLWLPGQGNQVMTPTRCGQSKQR